MMATVKELRAQAKQYGIDTRGMNKTELEAAIKARYPGRPSVFTPQMRERYLTAIMRGGNDTDSAAYAGIHPATVRNWRARLEICDPQFDPETEQLTTWLDDNTNPTIPELFEFFAAVKKAEADSKLLRLSQIEKAAQNPRYWTAAAWWLERKFPDEFGRRERRDVTVTASVTHSTTGDVDDGDVTESGENKLDALVRVASEVLALNRGDG